MLWLRLDDYKVKRLSTSDVFSEVQWERFGSVSTHCQYLGAPLLADQNVKEKLIITSVECLTGLGIVTQ